MIIDNPSKIKKAEIIVGIPSYNEEKTIDFVVEQVSLGLQKYFPDKSKVIINVDNDSQDKTKQAFFSANADVNRMYVSTEPGIRGKGNNFLNLFTIADLFKAKVAIVVDADLRSIRPIWIKKMASPVFEGCDYVAPYYMRCKTDATITNHLAYPLFYGLLGKDIRQPIGGDFGLSQKMVALFLKKRWTDTVRQYGIDVFMTATAVLSKSKICQVNLGSKIHNLSNPKLGPMFFQVADTLFSYITNNLDVIKKVKKVQPIEIRGGSRLPIIPNAKPEIGSFQKIFRANLEANWDTVEEIASQEVLSALEEVRKHKDSQINRELWIKIVYDFLAKYGTYRDKESLINALGFLYFGRASSFFSKNGKLTPEKAEKIVKERAKQFFKMRKYFLNQV